MTKNLNVEPVEGSYIRRNNLPARKVQENPLKTMKAQAILNQSNTEPTEPALNDEVGNSEIDRPVLENALIEREIIPPVPSKIKNIAVNEFYMNGKHIKFGKWKVRTRSDLKSCSTFAERRKVLVYDLLENFVPLDMEEFNYVLYRIRDYSYNNPIKYSLSCSSCGKDYEVSYRLSDLYRPMNGYDADVTKEHIINGKKISMTFTQISEKDFEQYENLITNETDEYKNLLTDFIYHIKSINDVEVTDKTRLLAEIEQWDTDVFEEFFYDFNSVKFYVDVMNNVKCPHCMEVSEMNFDEFPNFYPDSWVI